VLVPVNPPSIPGLGTTGGFEFWMQSQGDASLQQLEEVTRELIAKARSGPSCGRELHDQHALAPDARRRRPRQGREPRACPCEDVYSTLQTLFGSLYVSQFPKSSRLFQVILQAEPDYRMKPRTCRTCTCATTTARWCR
jgi:multidrug efflux pump